MKNLRGASSWLCRVTVAFIIVCGNAVGHSQDVTRVNVDAKAVGPVISPLLFGHNLEVTRRAVWQGLSAEMIANRKFAALENGMPKRWTATDGRGRVSVDSTIAYAGKYSVLLEDGGQIGQGHEWLILQGKTKYSFRLWVKSASKSRLRVRITNEWKARGFFGKELVVNPGPWQLLSGTFAAPATEKGWLEISGEKGGSIWIGAVSLMLADNFHGMRRDVIGLLRQLKPGTLRFPGGCYSEFYRWQDGLLPVDQRPPIGPTGLSFLLPNSDDVDNQEMGLDEFIALCEEVGAKPALTLRVSETSADDATSWVEYCNGSPETTWGRIRAERGHPEAYGVKTWFLGNELYYFGRGGMNNANNCAEKSRLFAEAVKKVDASVRLVGCTNLVGGKNNEAWNAPLLEKAGSLIAYVSYHDYFWNEALDSNVMAPVVHLRPALRKYHRDISLPKVFDEWNTMWGHPGSIGMGLCAAGVLHLLSREAKDLGVEQAYFFQPINEGAITVSPLSAELDEAGKVFALFHVHQGNRLLLLTDSADNADLDLCGSITPDGKRVYITAINRNGRRECAIELSLTDCAILGEPVVSFLIPSALDVNGSFVQREEKLKVSPNGRMSLSVPPYAIARISLTRRH